MKGWTNHKHPIQIQVKEATEELESKLLEFKGTMPAALESVIEKHLIKLGVIADGLKDFLTFEKECPAWLTIELRTQVGKLWEQTEGERFTNRVAAAKLLMSAGEEAGFNVRLADAVILRENFCNIIPT